MAQPVFTTQRTRIPLAIGLGFAFGFLLHQGGVTDYDVLMGQLLLVDFTVLKVFLSAIATASVLLTVVLRTPFASEHRKPGSFGRTVIGGLIFGVGFGLLGYCPGTIAGAIGSGAMEALSFGVPGAILGSYLFALCYPKVRDRLWPVGPFEDRTLNEILHIPRPIALTIALVLVCSILVTIELAGL